MFRAIFTSILAILCLPQSMTAQEKMLVHMKDGRIVKYDMSAVEYVEMQSALSDDHRTPAHDVEGTVGEGIDLGLSVKWADQNLGASLPQDSGQAMSWSEGSGMAAQAWGEGWRLPTEWEWQELYEKCSWQWTVNSGIPGRLITGPNGNSIFLPAAGVVLGGESLLKGNCGIYWTADVDINFNASAIGMYFDSASIYRMEYPMTNGSYIRLVKE